MDRNTFKNIFERPKYGEQMFLGPPPEVTLIMIKTASWNYSKNIILKL